MALLTLRGSTILVPTPMDVWSKTVMLEDLFLKKSQEKVVEAAPSFKFVDSEATGDEWSVPLDSYQTMYKDSPYDYGSTINRG